MTWLDFQVKGQGRSRPKYVVAKASASTLERSSPFSDYFVVLLFLHLSVYSMKVEGCLAKA